MAVRLSISSSIAADMLGNPLSPAPTVPGSASEQQQQQQQQRTPSPTHAAPVASTTAQSDPSADQAANLVAAVHRQDLSTAVGQRGALEQIYTRFALKVSATPVAFHAVLGEGFVDRKRTHSITRCHPCSCRVQWGEVTPQDLPKSLRNEILLAAQREPPLVATRLHATLFNPHPTPSTGMSVTHSQPATNESTLQ